MVLHLDVFLGPVTTESVGRGATAAERVGRGLLQRRVFAIKMGIPSSPLDPVAAPKARGPFVS